MDTDRRAPRHRLPDAARGRSSSPAEIALVSSAGPGSSSSSTRATAAPGGSAGCSTSPGRFLAVTQLGLTFIGFLASAYAAVSLTDQPDDAAHGRRPRRWHGRRRSRSIIVTLLLALFTIVFGELVPKSLALAHTERVRARALRGSIDVPRSRCSGPLVAVLTAITTRHRRGCSARGRPGEAHDHRRGAAILIVERGGEQGILEAEEEQMIHAVIELGDQRVHEVMVPRIAIVALPADGDRWTRRSTRSSRRATAGSRSTRRRSTRSSASCTPRTCCRSSRGRPASGRPSARCCGRRSSCPSR